jgi:hypothetical protein
MTRWQPMASLLARLLVLGQRGWKRKRKHCLIEKSRWADHAIFVVVDGFTLMGLTGQGIQSLRMRVSHAMRAEGLSVLLVSGTDKTGLRGWFGDRQAHPGFGSREVLEGRRGIRRGLAGLAIVHPVRPSPVPQGGGNSGRRKVIIFGRGSGIGY